MLQKLRPFALVLVLFLLTLAGWRYFLGRPGGEDGIVGGPDSAADYCKRAKTHLDRGNYDRAIADFSQAIALAPGDLSARVGRGLAYHLKGEKDLAAEDFRAALALIDPQRPRAPSPQLVQAWGLK